jgi:hypothetical protein
MSRNAIWTNSDGLKKGFGTHTVDNEVAAVFQGANGEVTVTQEIDMASLPAFASESSVAYPNNGVGAEHVIPRGSIIKGGYIEVLVACTGAGGDADFGTWSRGLATEVVDDSNGLKDSVLVATVAEAGDVLLLDGDLVADADDSNLAVAGAISNSDVVITASYTTAYTAGRVKLVVTYIPPTGSSGRVIAV